MFRNHVSPQVCLPLVLLITFTTLKFSIGMKSLLMLNQRNFLSSGVITFLTIKLFPCMDRKLMISEIAEGTELFTTIITNRLHIHN